MKASFKKIGTSMLMVPLVFAFANTSNVSADTQAEIIYDCTAEALGGFITDEFEMPVTIETTSPDSVAQGEVFYGVDSSATVSIPEDTVERFNNQLFWNALTGEVDTFEVHAENETATVNVADPALTIPVTDVPDSGDLMFTVPGEGGIDVGPFTAGQDGEVTLFAGDISAELVSASGGIAVPIDADCTPAEEVDGEPQNLTIAEIPIVEE